MKQYLHKRILFNQLYNGHVVGNPKEGVVQEGDPTGQYIKINNNWYPIPQIQVISVLSNGMNESSGNDGEQLIKG